MAEPKVYRSNYEWKCEKCPYPIKPQAPYYLQKIHMRDGTLIPKRYHVECPNIAGRTNGKSQAS